MSTYLQCDYRLDAGGGTQAAHEASRVMQALDVEQDAVGFRVGNQVIEDVAEVQIRGDPHGYHCRKADVVLFGPVEDRSTKRTRLGYQCQIAGTGIVVAEGCVEAVIGADEAETVRAQETDTVAVGDLQDLVFKFPARGTDLPKTR